MDLPGVVAQTGSTFVKLVKAGSSMKDAEQDRSKLYEQVCSFELVVKRLRVRIIEAPRPQLVQSKDDPTKQLEPWFRGVEKVGKLLDALERTMKTLKDEVKVTHGMEKFMDKAAHHWKKEKFDRLMEEIKRYWDAISSILLQDQFDLSLNTNALTVKAIEELDSVKVTTEKIRIEGSDTNSVVNKIETLSGVTNSVVKKIEKASEQIDETTKDNNVIVLEMRDCIQRIEVRDVQKQLKKDEEEKQKIAYWLSPLYLIFAAKQQDLIEKCFLPSGQWFLDSEQFVTWSTVHQPCPLRCVGLAGSGKTTISAMAVNRLQKTVDRSTTPVLFVYLDEKASALQTRKNLLGSILSQLIQLKQSKDLSPMLRKAYEASKNGTLPPLLADGCLDPTGCGEDNCIRDILYAELKSYSISYLIVDARDECKEDDRIWLDGELCNLQYAGVSIMTTSRVLAPTAAKAVYCDACSTSQQNASATIPENRRPLQVYWCCITCMEQDDAKDFDICQNCRDKGVNCHVDPSHQLLGPFDVELFIRTPDSAMKEYIKYEMKQEMGSGRTPDSATKEYIKFGMKQKMGSDRTVRLRDPRLYSSIQATTLGRILWDYPEVLDIILTTIVDKSDGVFLFPKLYVKTLKDQIDTEQVLLSLERLPSSLPEMYETSMINRVLAQNSKEKSARGMKILSILTVARQPMTLEALIHALAIRPHDTVINDYRRVNEHFIQEVTQGLVMIDSHPDPSKATVRLFHLTLHEYFEKTALRWFPSAHADLAATCLSYLGLAAFAEPCSYHIDFHAKVPEYPFVPYAAQHWGEHLRTAIDKDGSHSELESAAAEYLSDGLRVAALSQAAWCTQRHCAGGWDVRRRVEGLHIAAWFGLHTIMPLLVSSSNTCGINIVDAQERTYWQTPLMYACRRGEVLSVRKLLELGANVNISSGRGRTALMEAVEAEKIEVVSELLIVSGDKIQINAVCRADFARSALMLAVRMGRVDIVRQLLAHEGVDVNLQDSGGYSAICHAVIRHADLTAVLREGNGYANANVYQDKIAECEVIMQLLFDFGKDGTKVDLERVDTQGRAALSLAAEKNDPVAVKMLLDHGANPWLKDGQGGAMAIHRAAERGNLAVLESMASHIHCAKCFDDDGRSILHFASASNHPQAPASILLLASKDLDVNSVDKYHLTPLHEASRAGSVGVVETLLKLGAVRSAKDRYGRTPHQVAWQYERDELLPLLKHEAAEEISMNWTRPLWSLAKQGNKHKIAQTLADDPASVKVEREHITHDTALHWAVRKNQNESLVQMLQINDVKESLDLTNRYGRTALHVAAYFDNQIAAKLLIEQKANVNAKDKWDATPLMIAQSKWHFDFAVLLCAAGADLSLKGLDLEQMLFQAVDRNNAKAVDNLVNSGADILSKNAQFKTALEVAMEKGEEADDICRMLRKRTFFIKGYAEQEFNASVMEVGRTVSQPLLSAFRMPADALDEPLRSSSVPLLERCEGTSQNGGVRHVDSRLSTRPLSRVLQIVSS